MTNWKDILQPANAPKLPTPEFIRIELGLLPWKEYKELSIIKQSVGDPSYYFLPDKLRNTGRTTRMLVNAIYFNQLSKVYIAGFNQRYTKDLIVKADQMCTKLSINSSKLLPLPSNIKGLDFSKSYIFIDHYIQDYFKWGRLMADLELLPKKPINWR